MRVFEHLVVGPLDCNCYIVGDEETRAAIVIDPGGDDERIDEAIARHGLSITAIVATHAHFDHIVAADRLRTLTGAPFYLHGDDIALLDWYETSGRLFLGLELGPPPEIDTRPAEGDKLVAGAATLEVLHTPGHSPGSLSLVGEGMVFSGDTLFAGSIGRSDLPGGSSDVLLRMISAKLLTLDDDTVVYPGHGPATTVGAERDSNPFVGERSRLWLPPS